MLLQQLLSDIPVARFFENHYLKIPLAVPGGCQFLRDSATRDTLDRLLQDPRSDRIVTRRGARWAGEGPLTSRQIDELMADGYTLGIRHAHQHDAALGSLAAQFQEELGAEVDVHLYFTPASTEGFGWHYDAEEVFILQTQGSKEWFLRKNTVNPWPLIETLPQDMKYEREIMPLMRCGLAEGDWLYIPAGYWHRTQASEPSISLSVGLRSVTGLDVYDFVRGRLLDSLLWRCRLPAAGSANPCTKAELDTEYRGRLDELLRDLQKQIAGPKFVEQFLEWQRSNSPNRHP